MSEPKIDRDQGLLKTLEAEFERVSSQKERDSRPIHGPNYQDSGWITYERERMHEEVNRLRAQLGKGPVELAKVKKAESAAMGHVDYQRKLVLYCRDLVLED